MNPQDIQAIYDILKLRRVFIHHGDIVVFLYQLLCQGPSQLSAADNDNLHSNFLFRFTLPFPEHSPLRQNFIPVL